MPTLDSKPVNPYHTHYQNILDQADEQDKQVIFEGIKQLHADGQDPGFFANPEQLKTIGQKHIDSLGGDFTRGVKRGVDQLQGSLYGMAGLAGSALGSDTVRDWGIKNYNRNMDEAAQYPGTNLDQIKGPGSAIDWAQGVTGELVPSMAEAALGAAIGSLVAPGPGTAAGGLAGRTILKKSIGELTEHFIGQQLKKTGLKTATKEIAESARNEALKVAMKQLGAKVGMGAAVLPMEAGGNYGELAERGIDNPWTSLASGAAATALEYLGGNMGLVEKVFGPGAAKALTTGNRLSGRKRAAIEILKNMGEESAQEAGQELFSALNVVANTDDKLFTPENAWRIFESAAAGAIGGLGGGVTQNFKDLVNGEKNTEKDIDNLLQKVNEAAEKDPENQPLQNVADALEQEVVRKKFQAYGPASTAKESSQVFEQGPLSQAEIDLNNEDNFDTAIGEWQKSKLTEDPLGNDELAKHIIDNFGFETVQHERKQKELNLTFGVGNPTDLQIANQKEIDRQWNQPPEQVQEPKKIENEKPKKLTKMPDEVEAHAKKQYALAKQDIEVLSKKLKSKKVQAQLQDAYQRLDASKKQLEKIKAHNVKVEAQEKDTYQPQPFHTQKTPELEKKYAGRNKTPEMQKLMDRENVLKDLISEVKDETKLKKLTKMLKEPLLGDYGVSTQSDFDEFKNELEDAGIEYVYEASDGGNLGGLNAHHKDVHASADADVKKVWGEVYAKEAQKFGGVVFRTGGDEFRVIWPNFTKAEVAEIRKDIDAQTWNKIKELGLDKVAHPKKGYMPMGALYVNYGLADSRDHVNPKTGKRNIGDMDRLTDQYQAKQSHIYAEKVAKEHGFEYNKDNKTWKKKENQNERSNPEQEVRSTEGRRYTGQGRISGEERNDPGTTSGIQGSDKEINQGGDSSRTDTVTEETLPGSGQQLVTPPPPPKKLKYPKKEKALQEYKTFVDGLSDEQKSLAGELIEDSPQSPASQKLKIEKKLKEGNPQPAYFDKDIKSSGKAISENFKSKTEKKIARLIRTAYLNIENPDFDNVVSEVNKSLQDPEIKLVPKIAEKMMGGMDKPTVQESGTQEAIKNAKSLTNEAKADIIKETKAQEKEAINATTDNVDRGREAKASDDRGRNASESSKDVSKSEEVTSTEEVRNQPRKDDDGRVDVSKEPEHGLPRTGEELQGQSDGTDESSGRNRQKDVGEPSGNVSGLRQPERKPKRDKTKLDHRIQPGDLDRQGSWKEAANNNLDAIALFKKITSENRQATPDEQKILAKYKGWGASEIANKIFPGYAETGKLQLHWAEEGWKAQVERAQELLTPEELKTAAKSTQYAHYTNEPIIKSIYNALKRFGFPGGKILEPGMGVGNFVGLVPDEMQKITKYTGIEMDGISAGIAKLLYPNQNMLHADYVQQKLPNNFFDAAIGNPPFGSTTILADPAYKKYRLPLHNFFFAKSVDKVKPGGLMVFITSRYTMDSQKDKGRNYISDRADLLGAIRLPQTAFKKSAGTEVVTDVLFFKKREKGAAPAGESWNTLKEIKTPEGPIEINEYYANHPEMVLGQNSLQGSMYKSNEYTVLPSDGKIEDHFAKAVENLPENVYSITNSSSTEQQQAVIERDFNPTHKKEGGIYLNDKGQLMKVDFGSGVSIEAIHKLTPKEKIWLKDYIGLRDALKQSHFEQLNDGDWETALKNLQKEYKAFVKKHGHIRDFTLTIRKSKDADGNIQEVEYRKFKNDKLLYMDAEGALITALEKVTEDGKIISTPALLERTIKKPTTPKVETVPDALAVSLDAIGKLDINHIAKMLNIPKDEVIGTLGDLIYEKLDGSGHVMADEYLSGNVVEKLKEAEAAAKMDEKYQRNVDALKKVQPEPLKSSDVTVKIGANWIPTQYYNSFARDVLNITTADISYTPIANLWEVSGDFTAQGLRSNVDEWSNIKRGSNEILKAILNNQTIRITQRIDLGNGQTKVEVDKSNTTAANEIAEKMRKRFKSWIWEDAKRAGDILNIYNNMYNTIAPRKFDGSHLTLPGASLKIKLHDHQKRAIWRILQTGNTYLAHAVGAGKTFVMIASGMEMKRLGMIQKPVYVVPKHMLGQFAQEFQELYPLAHVMVADEKNFHTENRRRFVAQATLNSPDAIVMTHSSFGLMGLKPETVAPVREDFLNQFRMLLSELEEDEQSNRIKIKQMEKRIEQAEQRFDSLISSKKDSISFEEMGVDFVYVDEAHEFRKLDFTTNRQMKGIDSNGSKKAIDMFIKTLWLEKQNPGRSHVFASGTPITNTLGELYTVQRFFDNDALEELGIDHFDSWANMFGEAASDYEMNAAGRHEIVERFSKFVNIPELMSRVRMFMDVLTSSQLGERVKRPDIKGGSPDVVLSPKVKALKDYLKNELEPRIEASRKWKPSKEQPGNPDPIINIITDGRLASIDMRFVQPGLNNNPDSKLNKYIDGIIEAYHQTKDNEYIDPHSKKKSPIKGGTQICFFNTGFGAAVAERRGFNARQWAMKRFKEAGIPVNDIAWIDDYNTAPKKQAMFKEMKQGKKKILLGSAKKMGTGVNVQDRLTHLHYLDAPWYPADVEQPDGRIIRQGNQNTEVEIKRYATEGSYDASMWGMVARKSRFIEQSFLGDKDTRTVEDISEVSQYEMASALASGDERVVKLVGLKADIERLTQLSYAHRENQYSMANSKEHKTFNLNSSQKQLKKLQAAQDVAPPYIRDIEGKIGNKKYDSREDFGNALDEKINNILSSGVIGRYNLGTLNGVQLNLFNAEDDYQLKIAITDQLDIPFDRGEGKGFTTKIVNQINSIPSKISEEKRQIEQLQKEIARLNKKIGAPFEHEQELNAKIAEATALEQELAASEEDINLAPAYNPRTSVGVRRIPSGPYPYDVKYSISKGGKNAKGQRLNLRNNAKRSQSNDQHGSLPGQILDETFEGNAATKGTKLVQKLNADQKVIQRLVKQFGINASFFKFPSNFFPRLGGFVLPSNPDQIFINADSKDNILFVAGHETLHTLKMSQPDLYQQLKDDLSKDATFLEEFKQERIKSNAETGMDTLSDEALTEEYFADFVGQQFTNENFWKKIVKQNPSLGQKVLEIAKDILEKIKQALSKIIGGKRYFKDINKAQDVLAKVLNQYSKTGAATTGVDGDIKASIQTDIKHEVTATWKTMQDAYKGKMNKEWNGLHKLFRTMEYDPTPEGKALMTSALEREEDKHRLFNQWNTTKDDKKISDMLIALRDEGKTFTDKLKPVSMYDLNDSNMPPKFRQVGEILDYMDMHGEKWSEYRSQIEAETSNDVLEVVDAIRKSYDNQLEVQRATIKEVIDGWPEGVDLPVIVEAKDSPDGKELTLMDVYNRMGTLKGFYAPRVRAAGDFLVYSKKGKTRYMQTATSRRQAYKLIEQLKEQGHTDFKFEESKKLSENIMNKLNIPATGAMLKKLVGKTEVTDDVKKQLYAELILHAANEFKARGLRSSRIGRLSTGDETIKGYIENPLARFMLSSHKLAGGIAKSKAGVAMIKTLLRVDPEKDKNRYDVYSTFIEEQMRNPSPTDRMVDIGKSLVTFKYLGMNPRSALVNMTAMLTTVPAAIHQYATGGKESMLTIGKAIAKAGKDYLAVMMNEKNIESLTGNLNEDEIKFIQEMHTLGIDNPQLTRDAMANIESAYGNYWSRIMNVAMKMFSKTEQWNRGATVLAAYRLAREQGNTHKQASELAKDTSNKAHGIYGKSTLPLLAMGDNPAAPIIKMGYTYQKFAHNYLQLLHELGFRKKNYKAAIFALASPLFIGGTASTIMTPVLSGVIKAMMRAIGDDREPEKMFYDTIRESLGDYGEQTVRYGALGAMGIDLSGSLSIGVGVPKTIKDLTGPFGGVYDDIMQSGRFLGTGQPGRAAETILPTAAANIPRAIREAEGGATTRRGNRVLDEKGQPYFPDTGESILRGLGFRSSRQATAQSRLWESKQEIHSFAEQRTAIYEEYKAYLARPTPAKLQAVREKIRDYNNKIQKAKRNKLIPRITEKSLKNQRRRFNKPSRRIKSIFEEETY